MSALEVTRLNVANKRYGMDKAYRMLRDFRKKKKMSSKLKDTKNLFWGDL
jgi:hypothetical protein